jgi:hypothetical protein
MCRRRRTRLAAAAFLVVAFVAWNALFDRRIQAGAAEYFAQHDAWTRGEGPRPPMQAIMHAAAVRGARDATLLAGGVLVAGLVPVAWSRRRASGGSRAVA